MLQDLQWDGCRKETDYYEKSYGSRITSSAELTGATLTVLDKDGNVVDTWTSDAKEAHVIKRLVVGETYTLREEFAPYDLYQ
mgnify:CR=1 FL=1